LRATFTEKAMSNPAHNFFWPWLPLAAILAGIFSLSVPGLLGDTTAVGHPKDAPIISPNRNSQPRNSQPRNSQPETPASHPVIVVEADIYVNRFRTVAKLRFLGDDLELIQGVEAFDDGFYDQDEVIEATEDHLNYLKNNIIFRDGQGEPMVPRLIAINHIDFPEEGIALGQLINHQVEFEWEFQYEQSPEFITIEQTMGADDLLLPAELKVLLKQAGSDVPYAQMLKPQMPETFRFDWDLPILSQEASDQEWEEWFEAQREKSLGLISYSAVYSFLYIHPFEVRHEILIPLATVITMTDIERSDPGFLEVDEQDRAVQTIQKLLENANPLLIDGVKVKPVFSQIDFYGLGLADLATQSLRQRVSVANGRVGVIMNYSTKGQPSQVELTWDLFNHVVLSVDTVIITDDQTKKFQFSKYRPENTFRWTAPESKPLPPIVGLAAEINREDYQPKKWKVPALGSLTLLSALLCLTRACFAGQTRRKKLLIVGIGLLAVTPLAWPWGTYEINHPFKPPVSFAIEDEQAQQVFAQLHKNLFRAFDYRKESDIYDALEQSVDGELLRRLYLQIIQSLKMKEQGGSVARIDEVILLDGNQQDHEIQEGQIGFKFRCRWNLVGTVEHWGHLHQRTNQYEAEFEVALVDNAWKISEMQMLDEQEGRVKTTLRRF
jgi:hypothetical protein